MRLTSRLLGAACIGASLAVPPIQAQVTDSTARSTADSSFTDEQAGRGETVFTRVCLECHTRTDMANADFRLKWGGQTTYDLYKNIVTTMPDSDPGSLPRADYEDVVAYILKLNGVPAGAAPLAGDSVVLSRAKLVLPSKSASAGAVRERHVVAQHLAMRRTPWLGHGAR